jgi:hypothetical protein
MYFINETMLGPTIIQWRTKTWDALSKAAWEHELHLELLCWSLPTALLAWRLRGCDGGLSVMTPEPEVHFELLRWSLPSALPRRDWRRLSGCNDGLSATIPELEVHFELIHSLPCRDWWRLRGCDGGLSVMTPEPEVHFELLHSLPCRELRRLSGGDGSLSTMTWELEPHLEWSALTALSRSSTFSWLRCWRRLVISRGVGGDLKTWWVNWRLCDRHLGEIVSRGVTNIWRTYL